MELIVEISDCPISGLKRKVDVYSFKWNRRFKMINMECGVYYYENNSGSYGNIIESDRFRPYIVEVVASNDYYFNPNTGDIIINGEYNPDVHTGYVKEYDYWEQFAYQETIVADILEQQVVFADSIGKFN